MNTRDQVIQVNDLLLAELSKNQPDTVQTLLSHAEAILSDVIHELEFIEGLEHG